jgi:hypothetical protein
MPAQALAAAHKDLHIRARVDAAEDRVIHVAW